MSAIPTTSSENYYVSSATENAAAEAANDAANNDRVTHDQFLNLLTAQLTHQDPLEPMQDTEFMAQLAQLQALDEQISMTNAMEDLRLDGQLRTASELVGKHVTGFDVLGADAAGEVISVKSTSDGVSVLLDTLQEVEYGDIDEISNVAGETSVGNTIQNASSLIGRHVTGTDLYGNPTAGIVKYALMAEGVAFLEFEYSGKQIPLDSITEVRASTETDETLYQNLQDATALVGRTITGTSTDDNIVTGVVDAVYASNDTAYVKLDDGSLVPYAAITEVQEE